MYVQALTGQPDYAVRWVTDIDASRARRAAAAFGATPGSPATVVAQADALIVTTPPESHAALVEQCLVRGKRILCEKPFTTSTADAERLVALAAGTGAHLYVGHFRRLYPQVQLAHELVRIGAIGDVTGLRFSEGGRFTWRAESGYTERERHGGVLWDTGAHTLDMALYAGCLDTAELADVSNVSVRRDSPEPSHDVAAEWTMMANGMSVACRARLSRRDALPGFVVITGTLGSVAFLVEVDSRVRLKGSYGTTVVEAAVRYEKQQQCFALQCRRVLCGDGDELFEARRFINGIVLLEALGNA